MSDCAVLLAAKDPLRGDAALNWNPTIPIGEWDGITVAGTPLRVSKLDLDSRVCPVVSPHCWVGWPV